MLFLLKRTWIGGLAGLVVLALVGLGLRRLAPAPPPLDLSARTVALGVAVFALVLCSDGIIHGLLLLGGQGYRRLHAELVQVFRGQSWGAILAGAAMAGVGEELVFRGLARDPLYLGTSAVAFGLLHHLGGRLWPFTLWAVWQGVLFGAALWWTEALGVTMVAHFLHDLTGFVIFRRLRGLIPP
jgi:membrane protease YdiL (CAAX protease family)